MTLDLTMNISYDTKNTNGKTKIYKFDFTKIKSLSIKKTQLMQ